MLTEKTPKAHNETWLSLIQMLGLKPHEMWDKRVLNILGLA